MTTPFWSNDPTILFNKDSITQLWPMQQMTFEVKLNAISRIVCLLTILGFLFTRNWNILIIGILTLAIIFSIYKFRKQEIVSSLIKKEGFVMNSLAPTQTAEQYNSTTTNPITLDKSQ